MPARNTFDYTIIRVVPRVDRGEFLNAGVILFCRTRRYLASAIELDPIRLAALAPGIDMEEVRQHLAAIPLIVGGGAAAGPIGALTPAERFHWLVSPRSTLIQTSPVHSGLCEDPATALAKLLDTLVHPPRQ